MQFQDKEVYGSKFGAIGDDLRLANKYGQDPGVVIFLTG